MWGILKISIREQFFSENVEYHVRKSLQELRHMRSIRDYVKTSRPWCWILETCRRKTSYLRSWKAYDHQLGWSFKDNEWMIWARWWGRRENHGFSRREDGSPSSDSRPATKEWGSHFVYPNASQGGGDRLSSRPLFPQGSGSQTYPADNRIGSPVKKKRLLSMWRAIYASWLPKEIDLECTPNMWRKRHLKEIWQDSARKSKVSHRLKRGEPEGNLLKL